jgi:hypothetical protein
MISQESCQRQYRRFATRYLQILSQTEPTTVPATDVEPANMAHSDNILAINYQIDSLGATCMSRTSQN